MLRIFDAEENVTSGGVPTNPYCDFFDATQRYLRGGNLLCAYGPLFFPILETVLPKLSPIHWEYVQSVRTEDGVDVLLAKKFSRQDMFSRRPLHSFTGCSHSSLCRTATKENGSVRETTIPVISHRLLLLLDYLMPQVSLLVYCQLREESGRANSCIFFAALRGNPQGV